MKRALCWMTGFLLYAAVAGAQEPSAPGRTAALLTPLAEQGQTAAQYALGVIYANGDGVPADYDKAAQWFGAASRSGHVEARRHLLFMQQMGLVAAPPVTGSPDAVFRIQVASVANEADAAREWRRLQRRHPDALATLESSFVAFDAPDGARFYRVQGGPLDEEAARAVCARLRTEGTTCLTVRP